MSDSMPSSSSDPDPPLDPPPSTGAVDPRIWRVAAVVFLGPFMTTLDSTVVNISLSTIREELHASITSAHWIISGYLLALAIMLPLNGWCVDRLGAKRLYIACFSAFAFASFLCGTASSMSALIWARVFQGVAGGLLAPMTSMMIARVAGRHMARVMGYTAIPVLLAPIVGPVVAGAILKVAPWPWLFYPNLPVGALAVGLAAFLLPADEPSRTKRPFDLVGFLTISPGMAFLLYGLERASHRDGDLFLLLGIGLLSTFIWHARRNQGVALLDLRLFRNRTFSVAATTQFLSNGVSYAGQLLVPLYLITGCGLSSSQAGWVLAPMGLGMLCSYPFMGFLTERFGCRAVSTAGATLALMGTLPFVWMIETHFASWVMFACMFARGAGQGAIGIPSTSAAYASVPKGELAAATTAMNIVGRLGGPLATTIMAIVMSLTATYFSASGPHAFTIAFVVLIGLQLLVLTSANRLPILIHPKHKAARA